MAAVLPAAFVAVTWQTTLRPRSERRTLSLLPEPMAAPCPLTDQRWLRRVGALDHVPGWHVSTWRLRRLGDRLSLVTALAR